MVDAGRAYPATKKLYDDSIRAIPGARGSGIVAKKSGYHSSRNYNRAKHPNDYSTKLAEDLRGPADAAAAIDITPRDSAQQRLLTRRLRDAFNRGDPRVKALKEFYGSLDTTNGRNGTVFGLGKKSSGGAPYSTTADSSHLSHIHISIFRAYVDDWNALKGVVEILAGTEINYTSEDEDMFPKYGDKGAAVEYYQRILIYLGYALPKYGNDAHFGDETWNALKKWFVDQGGDKNWNGKRITPWIKLELEYQHKEKRDAPKLAKLKGEKGEPGPAGPPGKDGVLKLPAEFSGKITLTEK